MEIFVERMATIISTMNPIATGRVSSPANKRAPPTISQPPTKAAVAEGSGNPSSLNRTAPSDGKRNFWMPSDTKTPPYHQSYERGGTASRHRWPEQPVRDASN